MARLILDVNGAFDPSAGGLARSDLDELGPRASSAFDELEARRAKGEVGFADLPKDTAAADACAAIASDLAGTFENLLVLGIGGSSLGPRAVFSALRHPYHNFLPRERRDGPRVFFPDNSDPATFDALLGFLDLGKTCFATISKSGGTAETMAQHMVLRARLVESFGEQGYRARCVMITDPSKGALRRTVEEEGVRSLPVPPSIGGRFSVLSPVGLLPCAAAGVDIRALLAGALDMEARCGSGRILQNPAMMLAAVLRLMDSKRGRRLHVFMPYADALRDTGDWFVQLWAESLGKNPETGPTPIRAVGATDQHASLQLMMEGPNDKVVILVRVVEPRADLHIPVPPSYRKHPDFAYLEGHTMSELLEAERRATEAALQKAGRPTISIQVPKLDARAMGELVMLLELATAYAGGLYGVNAFDQPGVEVGKRLAQGLLGRPGYERARAEILAAKPSDSALVLG